MIQMGTMLAVADNSGARRLQAIRQLGDAYNRTRLTPFVKKLFCRWLAWTR